MKPKDSPNIEYFPLRFADQDMMNFCIKTRYSKVSKGMEVSEDYACIFMYKDDAEEELRVVEKGFIVGE
jgi:hypothetical protein